jgi:hypothetical protein
MTTSPLPVLRLRLLVALLLLSLSGCVSFTADDLTSALRDSNDPEVVQSGLPTLILLSDGFIHDDPRDEDKLMAGAELYTTYASTFVTDPDRVLRLTARARDYAERSMCAYRQKLCHLSALPFDEFQARMALVQKRHIPFLYGYATTWAGWIQARSTDWSAVADLPKVKAALQRVVAVNEGYRNGYAHLYLGVIDTLLPPALGGKPEEGRTHFERVLTMTQGHDLMVKVEYARRYARIVYDRTLHDRLLNEVLAAPVEAPGLTLSNMLAQRTARDLLKSADAYF